MANCLFAVVLALFATCLQAQEITENALYVSEMWQSGSRAVIVRAQEDIHLIEQWLEGTNIAITQVKCEANSVSELCTLLSSHSVVVRKDVSTSEGVIGQTMQNNTVASIMEKLFGPEFHLISNYNAMKEFQDNHPQHILAFARSPKGASTFEKYLYFLKALLTVKDRPTHIAVTKEAMALPLSHRPKHSKSAEVFIWLVSDGNWCQYGNSSHPFHIVDGIASFYKRINVPLMVRYTSEKLTDEYKEMGLFTSYVIHSPGQKKIAENVVSQLIEHYCTFFMFLIAEKADRNNKLTKALYMATGENNIIVIEPPITDMPPIHLKLLDVAEQDLVTMLAPIQEEYMEFYMTNPATGKPIKRRRNVVITDPKTVGHMAVDAEEDMMVAFCDDNGDQICGHFENSLQKVADIITTSVYQKKEIGFAVVRSKSLDDVRKFGVDSFPFIGYYNATDGHWSEIQETNFQEIINRALGQLEENAEEKAEKMAMEKEWDEEQKKFLKGNKPDRKLLKEAEKISREYQDPKPPEDFPQTHISHDGEVITDDVMKSNDGSQSQTRAIISEDDHFGQMSFSLGTPEYPEELMLNEETFEEHINNFATTMVTFYVPWEPHCDAVMHYMLQALEDLPQDSSSSLAVVNCADYPDLCSHYVITHYPTVLLFNASPNVWTTCKGTMDSRKMLRALENKLEERQDGLVELTYDTLPHLLTQDTFSQTVLVVWAGEKDREGEEGESGIKVIQELTATNVYDNFTFAWMNCKTHENLLLKVVQDFECESLLIFDFKQRAVYQLPPSEWLSQESLELAIHEFLSQYTTGRLTKSENLVDWSWPPLQPPIKFPSVRKDRTESTPKEPQPPSLPPPSSPSSMTDPSPPTSHHAHTEL